MSYMTNYCYCWFFLGRGIARAFSGGRVAHPEGQNEEESEKKLRKIKKTWSKFEERIRKLERLPTWDCESGYGPVLMLTKKGYDHLPWSSKFWSTWLSISHIFFQHDILVGLHCTCIKKCRNHRNGFCVKKKRKRKWCATKGDGRRHLWSGNRDVIFDSGKIMNNE